MSPRIGYKQTAEHKKKLSMARKKRKKPIYRDVLDVLGDPANEAAINGILAENQKRFDAARAYLKRLDTTPDAQLTHEERFIKRMGERG